MVRRGRYSQARARVYRTLTGGSGSFLKFCIPVAHLLHLIPALPQTSRTETPWGQGFVFVFGGDFLVYFSLALSPVPRKAMNTHSMLSINIYWKKRWMNGPIILKLRLQLLWAGHGCIVLYKPEGVVQMVGVSTRNLGGQVGQYFSNYQEVCLTRLPPEWSLLYINPGLLSYICLTDKP